MLSLHLVPFSIKAQICDPYVPPEKPFSHILARSDILLGIYLPKLVVVFRQTWNILSLDVISRPIWPHFPEKYKITIYPGVAETMFFFPPFLHAKETHSGRTPNENRTAKV